MAADRILSLAILFFSMGTILAGCSYPREHFDNDTSTNTGDILYMRCPANQVCCGSYTDRRCCLLQSSKSALDSASNENTPVIVLAGMTSVVVIIAVIGIVCWRLVCLSAYREAGASQTSPKTGRQQGRGQRPRTRGRHAVGGTHHPPPQGPRHVTNHATHHVPHRAPSRVSPPAASQMCPPSFSNDAGAFPEYPGPPSYEDTVKMTLSDNYPAPPAYTISYTASTDTHQDGRTDTTTCPDHVRIDMQRDEEADTIHDVRLHEQPDVWTDAQLSVTVSEHLDIRTDTCQDVSTATGPDHVQINMLDDSQTDQPGLGHTGDNTEKDCSTER